MDRGEAIGEFPAGIDVPQLIGRERDQIAERDADLLQFGGGPEPGQRRAQDGRRLRVAFRDAPRRPFHNQVGTPVRRVWIVPGGGRGLSHVDERGPADGLSGHQRGVHRLDQKVPRHARVLRPELGGGVQQHLGDVRDANVEHFDCGPGPQRAGSRRRAVQVRRRQVEQDLSGRRIARDHMGVRSREQALSATVRGGGQLGGPG